MSIIIPAKNREYYSAFGQSREVVKIIRLRLNRFPVINQLNCFYMIFYPIFNTFFVYNIFCIYLFSFFFFQVKNILIISLIKNTFEKVFKYFYVYNTANYGDKYY